MKLQEIVDIFENENHTDIREEDILSLISCPKTVLSQRVSRSKLISDRNQQRTIIELTSIENDTIKFELRIRISILCPENSSIILMFMTPKTNILLTRYNGPHNLRNQDDSLHNRYHIHRISPEDIHEGNFKSPNIRTDCNVHSFGDALKNFIEDCNIDEVNLRKYLPQAFLVALDGRKQINFSDLHSERGDEI